MLKKKLILIALLLSIGSSIFAQQRIVSLNGTISEMICALGLENQLVGVDITSTYPASLKSKPKVGHNRNISAEGIITLQPSLVIGTKDQINPQLIDQLKSAKVRTVILDQDLSAPGVKTLLSEVAKAVNAGAKAAVVQKQFDKQLADLKIAKLNKKVLFIYARGTGTMMVGGSGTTVDKMIQLAGAKNAVTEFADYKPLTAEALVAANPDVILLFTSGLESLNGNAGLLNVPGVAQTTAGKNKKFVSMDGELLSGFTLRLPQAIQELNTKLK